MDPILRFERVSKSIPSKQLLREVEASLFASDRIALLGPSGQGKSTLLRVLSLMDAPDSGQMVLQGVSYEKWKPKDWRKNVSYVAQHPFMLDGSVEDNLRTVSNLHRSEYDFSTSEKLLSKLGLNGIDITTHASSLSGGEKQRISLIRSLLQQSKLMLLDEITASLDHYHKLAVEQVMKEWQDETEGAWIWITHDWEQAARVANQIWVIKEGSLLIYRDVQTYFSSLGSKQEMLE